MSARSDAEAYYRNDDPPTEADYELEAMAGVRDTGWEVWVESAYAEPLTDGELDVSADAWREGFAAGTAWAREWDDAKPISADAEKGHWPEGAGARYHYGHDAAECPSSSGDGA